MKKTRGQTVSKKEIVDKIARDLEVKQTLVKRIVQDFLDLIVEELVRGNKIEFRNFGIFQVVEKRARIARNPKTGVRVEVPAKRVVKFRPGREMKHRLARLKL